VLSPFTVNLLLKWMHDNVSRDNSVATGWQTAIQFPTQADHLAPSSSEIKNVCYIYSYTPLWRWGYLIITFDEDVIDDDDGEV